MAIFFFMNSCPLRCFSVLLNPMLDILCCFNHSIRSLEILFSISLPFLISEWTSFLWMFRVQYPKWSSASHVSLQIKTDASLDNMIKTNQKFWCVCVCGGDLLCDKQHLTFAGEIMNELVFWLTNKWQKSLFGSLISCTHRCKNNVHFYFMPHYQRNSQ